MKAATHDGWTALMWVCKKGHCDIVRILLESGAQVIASDENGSLHSCWHVSMTTLM